MKEQIIEILRKNEFYTSSREIHLNKVADEIEKLFQSIDYDDINVKIPPKKTIKYKMIPIEDRSHEITINDGMDDDPEIGVMKGCLSCRYDGKKKPCNKCLNYDKWKPITE